MRNIRKRTCVSPPLIQFTLPSRVVWDGTWSWLKLPKWQATLHLHCSFFWLIDWLIVNYARKSKRELQLTRKLHEYLTIVLKFSIVGLHDSLQLALTISDNTVAKNCRRRIVAAETERPQTVPPHLPTKTGQVAIFAASVAPPNTG